VINLLPTPDQQQIIDSIAGYLAQELPIERLRPQAPQRSNERDQWADLAGQGWFGLGLSEDEGGAGFSVVEEMLAYREFGRALLTPSILATALAVHLASAIGDAELLNSLVGGNAIASLAIPLRGARLDTVVEGDFHLLDSQPGDLLVVWDDAGVALLKRDQLDRFQSVAGVDSSVRLERASASSVDARAFLPAATSTLRHRANLMVAASLVGMAEATRDLAVSYAGVRVQFDKPIGSFQAVAHHCADMEIRARAARAQTAFAAVAARDGLAGAAFQISAASIIAAEAALKNATLSIRVHGGMGYTAECDVHHYLKRAHLFEQLNGGSRRRQAELLAEPAPDLSGLLQVT
jgi:alkylation response protein AidB-like acyl-CoA dehydrogenase